MQVKDVMTPTVEVIAPYATLRAAGERMRVLDIGVLPVQDGDKLLGIITDRDMAVRAISQGLDPNTCPVGEVMTPGIVSCFNDQTLEEAAGTMATYRVRRLVVMNRAMQLAGILSLDDIAAGAETPALAGETLVHASSRPDHTHGFHRILVALDGSQFAERVFSTIEPLALKFGSAMTLLRVVAPVEDRVPAEVSLGVVSQDWPTASPSGATGEMRAQAEGYLMGVQKALEARGLSAEPECVEGVVSDVILRRARQLGADLIAITTHGRTGVDRMVFGSVAEEVLRRAPCPVLLVRVHDVH